MKKKEFILKLIDLRKRLELTKEITTITGLRALVKDMHLKNYRLRSKGNALNIRHLYGVFTSKNQFF